MKKIYLILAVTLIAGTLIGCSNNEIESKNEHPIEVASESSTELNSIPQTEESSFSAGSELILDTECNSCLLYTSHNRDGEEDQPLHNRPVYHIDVFTVFCHKAVSYTHLAPLSGGNTSIRMRMEVVLPAPFLPSSPNAFPLCAVKAVSYTHLDVYKRQRLFSSS